MNKRYVVPALLGLGLAVTGCGAIRAVPAAAPTVELTSFGDVWGAAQSHCLGDEKPESIRLSTDLNAQMVECWDDDDNFSKLTIVVADSADGFEEAAKNRLGALGAESAMGENWVVTQYPGKVAQATYELHGKTGEEEIQAIADDLGGWIVIDPEWESMYSLEPGEQAIRVLLDALKETE